MVTITGKLKKFLIWKKVFFKCAVISIIFEITMVNEQMIVII